MGVIPIARCAGGNWEGIPHVYGGDPILLISVTLLVSYSPYMWGVIGTYATSPAS